MAPTLPDPISDFSSSSIEDERLRRPKRRACFTLLNALLGLLLKKKIVLIQFRCCLISKYEQKKGTYLFLTLILGIKDLFFFWKNVASLVTLVFELRLIFPFPPPLFELEPFFVPAKVTWGLWLFAKMDCSNLVIFSSREIRALPPSWSESTPLLLLLT